MAKIPIFRHKTAEVLGQMARERITSPYRGMTVEGQTLRTVATYAYILQPKEDIPPANPEGTNFGVSHAPCWILKLNDDDDRLLYQRWPDGEKVEVEVFSLLNFPVLGSEADIEAVPDQIPQIIFATSDAISGKLWLFAMPPDEGTPFINDSGEDIDPYRVFYSEEVFTEGGIDYLLAKKSDDDWHWQWYVNRNDTVPPDGKGRCFNRGTRLVAYNSGTPVADEWWGVQPLLFEVGKDFPSVAQVIDIVDADLKYMLANFDGAINKVLIRNETGSTINAASSGAFSIQKGPEGAEVNAGFNDVTMYNRTSTPFADNKYGGGIILNSSKYALPWECA